MKMMRWEIFVVALQRLGLASRKPYPLAQIVIETRHNDTNETLNLIRSGRINGVAPRQSSHQDGKIRIQMARKGRESRIQNNCGCIDIRV